MWMATDRQPLENIVIRGWFWHLHHSCILFRCMKHSIIIVWYIPWKTFSSIIDFDICNTSHKNQGIVIPWKTFSSEVDWKKYDFYIGNKVAFFSDAWWTLSLYIGWPHEPHPTYIDPTDCVPRQRKEQGNVKVHLRVDPALDEALVDLLAVPGPVRLRAQRAAAVLAENSFATLVIKLIIRRRMMKMMMMMRRRRRRRGMIRMRREIRKLLRHLEPSQTPCTSTCSQEPWQNINI